MLNDTKLKKAAAQLCYSVIFSMYTILDTQNHEFRPHLEQNPRSFGHLASDQTKSSRYIIEPIFWSYALFPLFLSREVSFLTNFKINSFKASFYIIITSSEI